MTSSCSTTCPPAGPIRLPAGVPLIKADVDNRRAVRRAFTSHPITGVMHFAARKQVGESVERPLHYWSQNVGGLQVLLEEMVAAGTTQMVFSSSAAVYGQPDLTPGAPGVSGDGRILESAPRMPMNPYGATKLAGEHMIAATAHAHQWHAMSLRYFNVAGAASPELGDPAALNLIPMVLEALETGRRPKVFGDDYPTADGSCIRDYIHVADLSAAHVAAARIVEISHQAEVLRAAGDRVQDAAARAESAAARIPGGSAAVEAASQVPARAIERMPAAARAVEIAAQRIPGVIRSTTGPGAGAARPVTSWPRSPPSSARWWPGWPASRTPHAWRTTSRSTSAPAPGTRCSRSSRRCAGRWARSSRSRSWGAGPGIRRRSSPIRAWPATLLGWRARRSLTDMTDSAWAAWQARA